MHEAQGIDKRNSRAALEQGWGYGLGSAAMPCSGFGVEDQNTRR
jgi:hypothetical protein